MTVFASVSDKVSDPFGPSIPHDTVDSMSVKHCHMRSPCRDQDPSGKKVGSVVQGLPGPAWSFFVYMDLQAPCS